MLPFAKAVMGGEVVVYDTCQPPAALVGVGPALAVKDMPHTPPIHCGDAPKATSDKGEALPSDAAVAAALALLGTRPGKTGPP